MTSIFVHAIVGCGRVAPSHADAFGRLSQVRLKYACAPNYDEACKFAAKYQIEHGVTSLEQILDDPELTSISLATPHYLHAPMIMEAVRSGKHVLVEKPIAINDSQVDDIADIIVHTPSIVVMPVSQHRFDAPVREAARLVFLGALGRLVLMRAHLECCRPVEYYTQSKWRGKWDKEGGSVLINQAYHILDLMLWFGGEVETVMADMETMVFRNNIETEETLTGQLRFSNGMLGTLAVSGAAGSRWHSSIEIVGSNGVIGLNIGYPTSIYRLQLDNRALLLETKKNLRECAQRLEAPPAGFDYYGTSHRAQAQAFVDRILGKPIDPWAADLKHARQVIRTIGVMYQTAKHNRIVTVRHGT